jgi:hypothetical protein
MSSVKIKITGTRNNGISAAYTFSEASSQKRVYCGRETTSMQATASLAEIIANKLYTIADKIRKAETAYYEAIHELNTLKLDIEMREVDLFKSGKVDGKNELTRKGSILPETELLLRKKLELEVKVHRLKTDYWYLKAVQENYRHIPKLLSN